MNNLIAIKKYAINYLSKYDSSKKNLERILRNKIRKTNLPKKEKFILYNAINSILSELEDKSILDDKKYTYIKILNYSSRGKSKNFIRNYLLQKGLSKESIDEILYNFELDNANWELESAKIFARKKNLGIIDNKEKDLAKMARAGFGYDIIKKTLGLD